jgi:hypothetical protein
VTYTGVVEYLAVTAGSTGTGVSAVPEPGSLALLLLVWITVAVRRGR